jgi:hypothetical protein
LQITYDYQKVIEIDRISEVPKELPLTFTISPLLENIKEIRMRVSDDGDDVSSVTWLGKTQKVIELDKMN